MAEETNTAERVLADLERYMQKQWSGLSLARSALDVLEATETFAEKVDSYPLPDVFLIGLLKRSRMFRSVVTALGGNPRVPLRAMIRRVTADPFTGYADAEPYSTTERKLSTRAAILDGAIRAAHAANRSMILDTDVAMGLLAAHDAEMPSIANYSWRDQKLRTPYNTLSHIAWTHHPSLAVKFEDLIRSFWPEKRPNDLRIFLCHANEDKPVVRKLHRMLREKGYAPWMDIEDLTAGQDWQFEIRKALRQTDVVLVCLSTRAISKRGFVQKEIADSLDLADRQPEGSVFIIPVRLDPCVVPERLSRWHWVDAFSRDGYKRIFRALADVERARTIPST